jgi:hypothetical protein
MVTFLRVVVTEHQVLQWQYSYVVKSILENFRVMNALSHEWVLKRTQYTP